ncbi:hypothetical protein ABLE94_17285 [Gordonia sp. VNK1]|uniref:hypothetical protein n=1 Tax=Gordonia oleivorans TaxID=3156618 RepID=UPI0032B4A314
MSDDGSARPGVFAVLGIPRQIASAAADIAERVPVAGGAVASVRRTAHDVVDGAGAAALEASRTSLRATIRTVVEEVTAAVDVTEVIVDNVDLNQLLGAVDLNAVLAQVDLDALLGRLDLNAILARLDLDALLAGIDLDALIGRLDVAAIVDKVDIGAVVETVDIDAIVAQVDLDRAVTRVDIDAIINRIDLIGLADEIIDGVDLPDIIREASTSVTADVMTDVRGTSERADDAVAELVNRMLRRKSVEERRNG